MFVGSPTFHFGTSPIHRFWLNPYCAVTPSPWYEMAINIIYMEGQGRTSACGIEADDHMRLGCQSPSRTSRSCRKQGKCPRNRERGDTVKQSSYIFLVYEGNNIVRVPLGRGPLREKALASYRAFARYPASSAKRDASQSKAASHPTRGKGNAHTESGDAITDDCKRRGPKPLGFRLKSGFPEAPLWCTALCLLISP